MKSLLLFFDGIAILLPRHMRGSETVADPFLAGPLQERGLLRILEPETFVDQEITETLIAAVTELVTEGAFDRLNHDEFNYIPISSVRMGWNADVELSQMLIEELASRDLARPGKDDLARPSEYEFVIPVHHAVRTTILILLSQLARDAGRRAGLRLHPATTSHSAVDGLIRVMSLYPSPSAGHVVMLDQEIVGFDLRAVPLEDILEFREQHGDAYRAYARNVRQQVTELGLLDTDERQARLLERREELADQADDLSLDPPIK